MQQANRNLFPKLILLSFFIIVLVLAIPKILELLGNNSEHSNIQLSDVCDALKLDTNDRSQNASSSYHINEGTKIKHGFLFSKFEIPKEIGKGRVVQSMTISHEPCAIIAASSLGGKPEKLALWRYSNFKGASVLLDRYLTSFELGHGQDLSNQFDAAKNQWFWLGDKSGKKVTRFKLDMSADKFEKTNLQRFGLNNEKISNQMVSISIDGKYLIATGVRRSLGKSFEAFIYPIENIDFDLMSIDEVKLTPSNIWKLNRVQQRKDQWRQGVAAIGNTIFILTGNNKASAKKMLFTYNRAGEVLATQEVIVGKEEALKEGSHYEPEGLELVFVDGQYYLLIGIASGKLGNRKYRLWGVPLNKSK